MNYKRTKTASVHFTINPLYSSLTCMKCMLQLNTYQFHYSTINNKKHEQNRLMRT